MPTARQAKLAAAKRRAAAAGMQAGMKMGMTMGMAMAKRDPHPSFRVYRAAQRKVAMRVPPRHLLVRKFRVNPLVRRSMGGYRLKHKLPAKHATGLILIAHRPNPHHARIRKQVLSKYKSLGPGYMTSAMSMSRPMRRPMRMRMY